MSSAKSLPAAKISGGKHVHHPKKIRAFLAETIAPWEEVIQIKLGAVSRCRPGKKGSRVSRRFGGDDAVTLHATRDAFSGQRVIGVKCIASTGAIVQEVVLLGPHEELKKRLRAEGLGGNW